MKRHEAWRYWYRLNRYLRHLDAEELHQRGRDTMNANITLDENALISILQKQIHGSEAIEIFTHYLEECGIRQLPMTMGNNPEALKSTLPDLTCDLAGKAAAAIKETGKANSVGLFKFGKFRYL